MVQGTPEAASEAQDILICCQERRTLKHKLSLHLPGLQDLQDGEFFSQELILPANKTAALRNALFIEPAQASLSSIGAPLEYTLTFSPKKVRSPPPAPPNDRTHVEMHLDTHVGTCGLSVVEDLLCDLCCQ
jgi:hypothetical protein